MNGRLEPPTATPVTKRIGLHLRVPHGIEEALSQGAREGCGVIQVFASSPRRWAHPRLEAERLSRIRARREALDVELVLHAPYLVNLASPQPEIAARSLAAVVATRDVARQLGARSVVVHTGSHAGVPRSVALAQTAAAVLEVLGESGTDDNGPDLLLEPTAGGGTPVAARFEHLVELLDATGVHPRLGVCLDTCHLHAAGHDLAGPQAVVRTLDVAQRLLGPVVRLVHLNDTGDPLASHRDRHVRPGEGHLGVDALAAVVAHPLMAQASAVLETPGDDADRFADAARIRHAYALEKWSTMPTSPAQPRQKASGNDSCPPARRIPIHA